GALGGPARQSPGRRAAGCLRGAHGHHQPAARRRGRGRHDEERPPMTTRTALPSLQEVVGPRYRAEEVPVRGGSMHVGVWDPEGDPAGAPTVVAVHGITSSHVAWPLLAAAMPDVRVVAPDLRGRGRSRDLPGPYGMPSHADDVAAVLEHLGVERAVAVGHSMGGFVSLVLADRHPGRVSALVLVDGGLPLLPPAG